MRRNKGVSMITLIITIIVIIILAAIAFVGMDDATGSAQYAKLSSEFGDYATNFTGGAVTKVQESLGLAGKVANKAQIVYCAARGVNLSEFDKVLNGVVTPSGYTSPKFQTDIKDATGATYVLATADTPCYEIKDDVMKEYKGKSFYGNANGEETHWVTTTGKVFTLPGYPRTVDGEERMYISADLYYVPKDGEMILASKLIAKTIPKIGDETSGATVGSQTIADAADHASPSGNPSGEDTGNPEVLAKIKVGDYVEYTPDTAEVNGNYAALTDINYSLGTIPTEWRVWAIEGNDVIIVPYTSAGKLILGDENNVQKCYDDWKNAEEIIDKVCKIYTNKALGVTENSIRSLTIEDLEDEKVSNFKSEKEETLTYYTSEYTYKEGDYVAAYYDDTSGKNVINNKSNVEDIIAISGENRTVKNTGYYLATVNYQPLFEGSTTSYYWLLTGVYRFWLPTSVVRVYDEYDCRFEVMSWTHGMDAVRPMSIFGTDGPMNSSWYYDKSVCPLVTLSSTALEEGGVDGEFTTWKIKN